MSPAAPPAMSPLTRSDVAQLALLARLGLTDDELARMEVELAAILGHVASLAALDTTGVAPMTHAVPTELPLRADAAAPSLPAEVALGQAPARADDLFLVPAVLGGRGGPDDEGAG